MDAIRRFVKGEEGQTMMEYALIGALVAVLTIAAWQALQGGISGVLGDITAAL